jgi:hypothetical protein
MSRATTAYTVGGALAIIFVALAVYYLIPGVPHILTSKPYPAYGTHVTHILLFIALAVFSLIGARFVANSGK